MSQSPEPAILRLYKTPEGYAKMKEFYDSSLAKIEAPVETMYVDTPYGKTHMLAVGDEQATPLLLIQGLAGSAVLWHHQFADFAQKRRVYAVDIVGQPGRSEPNPLSLFDDSYARWLLSVMDALDIQQADIAGVSLGGWIIHRVGVIAPERIRKAVLLSPMKLARAKVRLRRYIANGLKGDRGDDRLEDRLNVREFTTSPDGESRKEYDMLLARAMALATKHYRLGLAMGLQEGQRFPSKFMTGLRVIRKFAASMSPDELASFKAKGLVLLGEHEMLYDAQHAAQRVRDHAPNLSVHILDGAGHAAIYDHPEIVNPLILDYFDAE